MEMASQLRSPRRSTGGLRRTTQARAIRGSNRIEGHLVSADDALAAVDNGEPLSTDDRTWAEIQGYRRVLTFVLRTADDTHFRLDSGVLRSMHYMLLEHDLEADPGHYRQGAGYVFDDAHDTGYEGPEAGLVPDLVAGLVSQLAADQGDEPMIRAAMAHLNLVMIHPFRDGNGRMARALQTLVLAGDRALEPTFAGIEEWLGANPEDYHRVLALTGGGTWQPGNDTQLWIKFNLRAHHMQAQTLRQRFDEAERLWRELDGLVTAARLPDRATEALFDAALGLSVRRPGYVKRAEIEERTATRDLLRMVEHGLLAPVGNTRGRHYLAGTALADVRARVRAQRIALTDPYPWLRQALDPAAR